MTALAGPTLAPPPPPGPHQDPGARQVAGRAWRWARLPLLIVALLIVAASALLIYDLSSSETGQLNPRSYRPDGANALRVLVEQYGTPVETVDNSADALQAARAGNTTLLISDTYPLSIRTIRELATLPSTTRLVLLRSDSSTRRVLLPGLTPGEFPERVPSRPSCSVPEARAAGPAGFESVAYDARKITGVQVVSCYDGGLVLMRRASGPEVVAISDDGLLTNQHLDEYGNAALGINLLSTHDRLHWLYLEDSESAAPEDADSDAGLFPPWAGAAVLYLMVAGALAALWRARRLGTPVPEPLPVVVRSAETTEGRARLYRRARARPLAVRSLRGGALAKITPGLGLGPDPDPRALIEALAPRTGRTTHEVHRLLYAPPPADDQGLVALAADLDRLADDFRTSLTIGRPGADPGDRDKPEGPST